MLQTIVLVAEIATIVVFLVYGSLLWSLYGEGRHLPLPKPDPVGDVLRRHAQHALILGYGVFFTATAFGLI